MRRLLAPVALGLVVQTSTGCTLVGYEVGNATIPAPKSFPPQNARAIALGTEVEVFYLPRGNESGHGEAEFSLATGAYAGLEGDQLVLNYPVSRAAVGSHEAYDSSTPVSFETRRHLVPLEQVSLIRTKPSSTPAVVGTVVGAALDLAFVVSLARAVRNLE